MRFYTKQHKYYCGIDLHAKTMYVCIMDQGGQVLVHRNLRSSKEALLKVVEPYREDICVGVECVFTWYWVADLCTQEGIAFVLGHALYLKAIHGGKSKNDKIDSHKLATILRGGMFPMAYVYPEDMRSTRDLLRRRMHLMWKRAELLAHIQNTKSQYNLPDFGKKIAYKANRTEVVAHFPNASVRKSMEMDVALIDFYDRLLNDVELYILRTAKGHDPQAMSVLKTVPGIGKILALVMLYEIEDISRFASVQDFVSYSRLVKCVRESAGKMSGSRNNKIGNVHLKWAFSEAACLFLRGNEPAQKYHQRLVRRHGKGKALGILSHKLGRAVYFMLKRRESFNMETFFSRA
jgi:transposase